MKPAKLRIRFGQVIRRRRLLLIERGQRMPTLYVVHQLAEAIDTTMVKLMRDEEPEEVRPLPKGRPPKKGHAKKQGR